MLKYISMHLKAQLEYKSSFIFLMIGNIIAFFGYCIVFYSLFDKFGIVKSFSIYQVILCFAISKKFSVVVKPLSKQNSTFVLEKTSVILLSIKY